MLLKGFFKNLISAGPKKAFYVLVRCADCGEDIRVRISRSSDFQIEYAPRNPEHFYTIKKEIIGKDCFNLMQLTLALTKNLKVLFADTKACEFITFDKEAS